LNACACGTKSMQRAMYAIHALATKKKKKKQKRDTRSATIKAHQYDIDSMFIII
jgi:hypothetical protein